MLRLVVIWALTVVILVGSVSTVFSQAHPDPLTAEEPDTASADSADDGQDATAEKKKSAPGDEKSSDDDGAARSERKKDKTSASSEESAENADSDAKDRSEKSEKPAAGKDDAKSGEKEGGDSADKKEAKKRKTHRVAAKRLRIDLPLDGIFVASKMTEVALRPEVWSDYEIVEVASLGAKVRKGETLFKFDDRKLNEEIAELELEQRLNELSILRAEEELPRLEKTLAMDLALAERADRQAREDFERYNEIERPMYVKSAEFMTKYYQFMLDYEQDELAQLDKMYEADDLTEETEELVLKRQRNYVEVAEFNLAIAKLNRDETINVRLPRYDVEVKESLERTALALARAKMAFELDLNRARYELEQRKQARTKSLDRHAKLLADRSLMEIRSPADGVVYYGRCVNGRWSETASLISKYEPKNNVMPGAILMTIVDPRPLYVTSTFDESKRPEVSVGQTVKIALPAEGAQRVAAKVKSISPIEVSPGKFEISFDLEEERLPEWVIAGMSCKLKINTYDQKDALTVPKAAVHADEDDEDIHYVWLADPDDEEAKPRRRNVKLGRRSGDDVEIIKGLKKGDVVSLDDENDAQKQDGDDD